ncbi:putative kinase [Methylobacterium sp. PvP062]|uniref:Kinase n=1 Tax=Methylobacterium radiotolerans TaxID=31998 RepID=A0ABV2NGR2_9HYPH|nr:putative kinase [Methylobacterium sp. PvP105]MBP2502514.1 putative kinase [Methylobacterium sp. PvP109]
MALLRLGLSVVLDFPANTVASRARMRTLFEAAGVAHRLHVPTCPTRSARPASASGTPRVPIPSR